MHRAYILPTHQLGGIRVPAAGSDGQGAHRPLELHPRRHPHSAQRQETARQAVCEARSFTSSTSMTWSSAALVLDCVVALPHDIRLLPFQMLHFELNWFKNLSGRDDLSLVIVWPFVSLYSLQSKQTVFAMAFTVYFILLLVFRILKLCIHL